mgnify:CR=1 FL=1
MVSARLCRTSAFEGMMTRRVMSAGSPAAYGSPGWGVDLPGACGTRVTENGGVAEDFARGIPE